MLLWSRMRDSQQYRQAPSVSRGFCCIEGWKGKPMSERDIDDAIDALRDALSRQQGKPRIDWSPDPIRAVALTQADAEGVASFLQLRWTDVAARKHPEGVDDEGEQWWTVELDGLFLRVPL